MTKEEIVKQLLGGEIIIAEWTNHPILKYDIFTYAKGKVLCLYICHDKNHVGNSLFTTLQESIDHLAESLANKKIASYSVMLLNYIPEEVDCSKILDFSSKNILDSI